MSQQQRSTFIATTSFAFGIAQSLRGGNGILGKTTAEGDEEDVDEEEKVADIRLHPEYDKLQAYRMKQQVLLQLRATFLSEALAKRGLPLPSIQDVSTPDGKTPPEKVDWDCALSTEDDPKHCLISYEPEIGTKLICPMELSQHSDKWITLAALNRLRRDDPSKVEPMWSDKYAVLTSWFSPCSRYSLLQHVGTKGVLLNTLLDGNRLSLVAGMILIAATVVFMPVIEYICNRILVSGILWMKWPSWGRYVHIGLPFKLLIAQIVLGYVSKGFSSLVLMIKDKLVDLECRILEETIPLTLGVDSNFNEKEEEPLENLEENEEESEYDDDE